MTQEKPLHYHSHRLFTYELPYHRPVIWKDTQEDRAMFLGLELTLDSGHVGWAEITVKPTWNGASIRTVAAALQDLLIPRLTTIDLRFPALAADALEIIPENQAAKTLLDNAIWDAFSQYREMPLWQLWGGHPSVEVSWAVTRQHPDRMCDEAVKYVEDYGFRVLKIKGGQSPAIDLDAITKIHEALGDKVGIYVDANGAYSTSTAQSYVHALDEMGVLVIEDPCTLVPDSTLKSLQACSQAPILVDFDCRSQRDADLFLAAGAQALSLKPGRLGLSAARTIAKRLEDRQLTGVVGLFGESALGSLCALQLAATLSDSNLPAEVTWYLSMRDQFFQEMPTIQDGRIILPSRPLRREYLATSMRTVVAY